MVKKNVCFLRVKRKISIILSGKKYLQLYYLAVQCRINYSDTNFSPYYLRKAVCQLLAKVNVQNTGLLLRGQLVYEKRVSRLIGWLNMSDSIDWAVKLVNKTQKHTYPEIGVCLSCF